MDFDEIKDALITNLQTRREALRLLNDGITIIVFPGGGVATAANPFGCAEALPWKTFTAKMIRSSKATVLPLHSGGQIFCPFHVASLISQTLGLVRQTLVRLCQDQDQDQKKIMNFLQAQVMQLRPSSDNRLVP